MSTLNEFLEKALKDQKVDEEKLNEVTMPAIIDMKISLRQTGTSYIASSDKFEDRYDGVFKRSFTGQGQTPHAALKDLMMNVYKYYTKSPQKGRGHKA